MHCFSTRIPVSGRRVWCSGVVVAAFNVLLILFQVTVSDVSQVGIPITIAK